MHAMGNTKKTGSAPPRRGLVLIIATVLAVIVGLGLGFLVPVSQPELPVSQSIVGGPFEMVNHLGEPVTQDTFRGRYMLIYFGYTFCPDVCPTELQTMSLALDEMGAAAGNIVPIFVTIDPERDTVAAMRDYVGFFHPRMVGLTGTPEQVRDMAGEYGVYFARARDTGSSSTYLMDHSSLIFLMDPQGRYVTHLRGGMTPEAMARVLGDAL